MNRSIYITVLGFLLASCHSGKEESKKEDLAATASSNIVQLSDEQLKMAGITTGNLKQKNIASVLRVNGKIDVPPQNMVSISFPLGGYLKTTRLLPGMHVNKGEVIAVMEDQQYIQLQQDYLIAKSKMVLLEKDYNRQKDLNAGKAASDKVLEQAETEYKSQEILLSALYQKLQLIGVNASRLEAATINRSVNIYSPITGFVSKVNVNIGKYVNPTDVLFEIVNPADIHLALTVFEKDIAALSKGQKVIAYTNSNPAKRYQCEIILIGQDIGSDRSVEVHCHFEKYDKELIPGTFMNADIETKNRQVWSVSEEALVTAANKQYLFTIKDTHTFELMEVKTGAKENGYVEIVTDEATTLQKQSVVIKGAYTLFMKMKNTADEE